MKPRSANSPTRFIAKPIGLDAQRRRCGQPRLDTRERLSAVSLEGYDEALIIYLLGLGTPVSMRSARSTGR